MHGRGKKSGDEREQKQKSEGGESPLPTQNPKFQEKGKGKQRPKSLTFGEENKTKRRPERRDFSIRRKGSVKKGKEKKNDSSGRDIKTSQDAQGPKVLNGREGPGRLRRPVEKKAESV